MAVRYSGQYAAAQLGKLPLPHSLQLEIAEYVRHDSDALLPPTYLTLARMLGRVPTDYFAGNRVVSVRAFDNELSNYHGDVSARCMTRRGLKLVSVLRRGPIAVIRRLGADQLAIYDLDFSLDHTHDDLEFFRLWREKYGEAWPLANNRRIHPGLVVHLGRYTLFSSRQRAHTDSISTIINRHNSAVNVFKSFNRPHGEYSNDSDSD